MSAPAHVRLDMSDVMATLTIDRPEKRNALALDTIAELRAALDEVRAKPALRVVVLTGAGDRAFASGADLDEIPEAMVSAQAAQAYDEKVTGLYRALMEVPVPVVARVQAAAIGGGLLLALACDITICAANVEVGVPASRIGLMLSPVEHELLVRHAGRSRARLMLFTGRLLDARQARDWGLVDVVAEAGTLDDEVQRMTDEIAAGAPLAIKAAKRLTGSVDRQTASACYREVYESADLTEGLAALAEKRPARFQGR